MSDRSPEVLRNVAMATNFGTKIAITGFVRMIATRQLVMEGVRVVGRPLKPPYMTNCLFAIGNICQYLVHWGRCHGNHFLAFCIWGAHWCHLEIQLNRPCVAVMRPYVKLF